MAVPRREFNRLRQMVDAGLASKEEEERLIKFIQELAAKKAKKASKIARKSGTKAKLLRKTTVPLERVLKRVGLKRTK